MSLSLISHTALLLVFQGWGPGRLTDMTRYFLLQTPKILTLPGLDQFHLRTHSLGTAQQQTGPSFQGNRVPLVLVHSTGQNGHRSMNCSYAS